MSTLTERTIVRQVTHLPESNSFQVQWVTQVIKGDYILAETCSRKAYTIDQKAEFLNEVEKASKYVKLAGW